LGCSPLIVRVAVSFTPGFSPGTALRANHLTVSTVS